MGSLDKASLPIVDISPFLNPDPTLTFAHHQTIATLQDALVNHGFFYLTGHAVPESTTSNILSLARSFFTGVSIDGTSADHDHTDEKGLLKRQDAGINIGDGARGYQVIGESELEMLHLRTKGVDCARCHAGRERLA
jgi:isopenicillin N synthase-like dioxygenase